MDPVTALTDIASTQQLMSARQLRDRGCSRADISRATRAGGITRIHRGVYGLSPLAPRLAGAALRLGRRRARSHDHAR